MAPSIPPLSGAFLLSSLLLACAGEPQEECQPDEGRVEGVVYADQAGGDPSPGARISFWETGSETFIETVADENGFYGVDLHTGSWTFTATDSSDCFPEEDTTVTVQECRVLTVDFHLELCTG